MRELSSIIDEFSACFDEIKGMSQAKVSSGKPIKLDGGLVLDLGGATSLASVFGQVKDGVKKLYNLADEALLGLDKERANVDADVMLESLEGADEILKGKSQYATEPTWEDALDQQHENIRHELNIISQYDPT